MSDCNDIHAQRLLIVDFGSQYTQLIARRIRECGVYCEIYPFDVSAEAINEFAPMGVILSGGPESVTEQSTPRIDQSIFDLQVPVLGICYGMQAMAQQFGGQVSGSDLREFGHAEVRRESDSAFIDTLLQVQGGQNVWMSHGDKVTELPPDFVCTASSGSAPIAAMECAEKQLFGVQFHPEVTHTAAGYELLSFFARQVCGCAGSWTPANIVEDAIKRVREQVGDDKVVLGLSGGVDSSVVAALLARAIGSQLTCIFVDNGLLRKDEKGEVEAAFNNAINAGEMPPLDILTIDAEAEFLGKLSGLDDPEAKRKVIGGTFIDVFDREAHRLEGVKWLAQGTIYPDVIESISVKGPSATIKSHHNVGGLPKKMSLSIIEPLKMLFKDEVRKVGVELAIKNEILSRHPFPGPGLGIRILGEINAENVGILQEADHIFIESLKQKNLYNQIWQAGVILLPVKSVGVMGDERTYENCVALRAVISTDGMTADWFNFPHNFLQDVSNKIINNVKGINRVVYDISSKPPSTIEWE